MGDDCERLFTKSSGRIIQQRFDPKKWFNRTSWDTSDRIEKIVMAGWFGHGISESMVQSRHSLAGKACSSGTSSLTTDEKWVSRDGTNLLEIISSNPLDKFGDLNQATQQLVTSPRENQASGQTLKFPRRCLSSSTFRLSSSNFLSISSLQRAW